MFAGRARRWKVRGCGVGALVLIAAAPALARAGTADQATPVLWPAASGCLLALGAMALGGTTAALSERDRTRKTGVDVMAGGLALAPVLSHALAGETQRAAVFAAITVPLAALSIGVLEGSDHLLDHGHAYNRIPFGVALALDLLVASGGLVDSLMAGTRGQQRPGLALVPLVGAQTAGVAVAGAL
jgi:hypothetical protein